MGRAGCGGVSISKPLCLPRRIAALCAYCVAHHHKLALQRQGTHNSPSSARLHSRLLPSYSSCKHGAHLFTLAITPTPGQQWHLSQFSNLRVAVAKQFIPLASQSLAMASYGFSSSSVRLGAMADIRREMSFLLSGRLERDARDSTVPKGPRGRAEMGRTGRQWSADAWHSHRGRSQEPLGA